MKLEHSNELAVGRRDDGSEEGFDRASMKSIYAWTMERTSHLHIQTFLNRHLHLSYSIFYPNTAHTCVLIPILVFKV